VSLYVLDTDILTLLRRNHPVVQATFAAAVAGGDTVALNIVSVEEQIDGWLKAQRTAKLPQRVALASQALAELIAYCGSLTIYPQTEASLTIFDSLVQAKLNVAKNDLRIASVALDLGATLVTRNLVDFRRIPNLVVEDWAVPPTTP
jgi:tRNA(fMet)-specific endonuclease VapC